MILLNKVDDEVSCSSLEKIFGLSYDLLDLTRILVGVLVMGSILLDLLHDHGDLVLILLVHIVLLDPIHVVLRCHLRQLVLHHLRLMTEELQICGDHLREIGQILLLLGLRLRSLLGLFELVVTLDSVKYISV